MRVYIVLDDIPGNAEILDEKEIIHLFIASKSSKYFVYL